MGKVLPEHAKMRKLNINTGTSVQQWALAEIGLCCCKQDNSRCLTSEYRNNNNFYNLGRLKFKNLAL